MQTRANTTEDPIWAISVNKYRIRQVTVLNLRVSWLSEMYSVRHNIPRSNVRRRKLWWKKQRFAALILSPAHLSCPWTNVATVNDEHLKADLTCHRALGRRMLG